MDSSDDENINLLKEAADFQFINDSMFTEKRHGLEQKVVKEKLPSLRKSKDDDEQYNLFKVTPEFRQHVAKHLVRILDAKLAQMEKDLETGGKNRKKRKIKGGVKLLNSSTDFLNVTKNVHEFSNGNLPVRKTNINNKMCIDINEESLRQIVVEPNDIFNKKEIKHWSNRSKAPIFHYKMSNGNLTFTEPVFK